MVCGKIKDRQRKMSGNYKRKEREKYREKVKSPEAQAKESARKKLYYNTHKKKLNAERTKRRRRNREEENAKARERYHASNEKRLREITGYRKRRDPTIGLKECIEGLKRGELEFDSVIESFRGAFNAIFGNVGGPEGSGPGRRGSDSESGDP